MPFARFRVGLDYAPPRGWADFDAVGLGADLDLCADLGIDLVRIALPWDFLGPSPERASQVAMGKLLASLDAAHARKIEVMPAILAGKPPYLADREPWDDPYALRVQIRHLRQLGERFRSHPAIVAWDLGATPDRAWGPPAPDAAWLWAHAICAEWKRLVPRSPLVVAFRDGAGPWDDLREHLDYAGVALDPAAPAAFGRWPQDPLVPAFRAALAAQASGRPVIVTAYDMPGEAPAGTYHREALEAAWKAGAIAMFASFGALRFEGGMRPHSDDLAAYARQRRPIQPVPAHVNVDRERFQADPEAALKASFHAFAV